jgi:hypothetical protein
VVVDGLVAAHLAEAIDLHLHRASVLGVAHQSTGMGCVSGDFSWGCVGQSSQ